MSLMYQGTKEKEELMEIGISEEITDQKGD